MRIMRSRTTSCIGDQIQKSFYWPLHLSAPYREVMFWVFNYVALQYSALEYDQISLPAVPLISATSKGTGIGTTLL